MKRITLTAWNGFLPINTQLQLGAGTCVFSLTASAVFGLADGAVVNVLGHEPGKPLKRFFLTLLPYTQLKLGVNENGGTSAWRSISKS